MFRRPITLSRVLWRSSHQRTEAHLTEDVEVDSYSPHNKIYNCVTACIHFLKRWHPSQQQPTSHTPWCGRCMRLMYEVSVILDSATVCMDQYGHMEYGGIVRCVLGPGDQWVVSFLTARVVGATTRRGLEDYPAADGRMYSLLVREMARQQGRGCVGR